MACTTQLSAASACVQADPGSCACFSQPFDTNFPGEMLNAFRSTLAFEIPGSEFFCPTANENVCMQLEVAGNCCCQDEVLEYISCAFTNELSPTFGVPGCEFDKCGLGGEDGGGSFMMIVIIASAVFCCGLGGLFFYCRRRRARSNDDKEAKVDSWEDRDIESHGKKSRDHTDSDSESGSRYHNKGGKRSQMKKRASKNGFHSDSEDSHSDYGRGGRKKGRKYDSDSDSESDDDSHYRRSGKKSKTKGKKDRRSISDSEHSFASRSHRSRYSDSRRSDRRHKSKNKSNRRSDSESDDDSVSYRNKKKNRHSRKKSYDSDEDSYTRRKKYSSDSDDESFVEEKPKKKKKPTVEESVRQARSILKTVKESEKSDGNVSVEVQQVMNSQMAALIAQLKEQKDEMERKLLQSETETTKLRLEKEASQRHIIELETKKNHTEKTLEETKKEAKMLQANQTLDVANKEAEKIKVSAELDQVRKEREEMAKMIKRLEKAKENMEGKLKVAQDEATVLRVENTETAKRMTEVEKDREALRQKLFEISRTREDIERRLQTAEVESSRLRSQKKSKSREIHEERASTHVRKSYLEEMEAERKSISRQLRRIAEDKEEMRSMMEKLNASHQRLTSLVEDDEVSLGVEDLQTGFTPPPSHRSRHTPTLATIQSPGNLGHVTMQRRPSLNDLPLVQGGPRVSHSDPPTSYVQQQKQNHGMMALGHQSFHTLQGTGSSLQVEPTLRGHQSFNNLNWDGKTQTNQPVVVQSDDSDRPAGWLGSSISQRSFSNLATAEAGFDPLTTRNVRKKDPSHHVRSIAAHTTESRIHADSQMLRLKREKARRSERRLRGEIDRSRSNHSMTSGHSSDESLGITFYEE